MARKPNYGFERNARAKAKAEKREAKRAAKLSRKGEDQPDEGDGEPSSDAVDGSQPGTENSDDASPEDESSS